LLLTHDWVHEMTNPSHLRFLWEADQKEEKKARAAASGIESIQFDWAVAVGKLRTCGKIYDPFGICISRSFR
jgi:hypothetical protein